MMTLKHNADMHPEASREAEPPPPPPSAVGYVTLRMGETSEKSLSQVAAEAFWPVDSGSVRQVVLVQLSDPDEFVAFGIFPAANHLLHCCKVPFVAWGRQSTDLDTFLQKMTESGAEVGWFAPAPLADMQACVSDIEQKLTQQGLRAA